MFLRYSISVPHTQLTLRNSKVPELLSVLGFLQKLITIFVEEGYLASSLSYHSLNVLSLYNHIGTILIDGIRALSRSCLRNNHQRCRFLGQCLFGSSTHTDNVPIHHFETDNLCLTTVRNNCHTVSFCLYICCHSHSSHHQRRSNQ